MASDGHDFVSRRATFRQSSCCSLSQAVRRAVRKIGLIAPVAKFVSEPCGRKRSALFGHKERQMRRGRSGNDLRKVWVQRDVAIDRASMLVLCLSVSKPAIANVL